MGIQFSDEEEAAFLATMHTGIVTTVRSDGWPITLPVWFVFVNGAIYFSTPSRSKKVTRIAHDDRGCFLVEAGVAWADLHAVLWLGRFEVVEDGPELDIVGAAIDSKYGSFRSAPAALPDATKKHYGRRSVVYRLRPTERKITWDNRKIRSRE